MAHHTDEAVDGVHESRLVRMSDSALEAQEPDNSYGGLSVVDFPDRGVVWSVRKAIDILPKGKRPLLYLAAVIQISLGILDLIGIALIGLVAAVAVSGIGATGIPPQAERFLDAIGLGSLTVSQLSVILALAAVTILVLKTALSALLYRRITRFLANRQAEVSASLARQFLSRPLAEVQRWTTSEAIYALGPGVSAATVALLGASIIAAAEIFLFAIVGITLFIYDPVLTIIAGLVFAAIALFLHRVLGRWIARNAEVIKGTSIDTLTAVTEALATYREATVLNRRELYVEKYERLVGRQAVAGASTAFITEIPKYALEITLYLGILVLGVYQFLTKDWAAAASTVALFLAAGSRIVPSLLRLQGAGITIRNSSVAAQPTYFMSDFLAKSQPADASQTSSAVISARDIERHIASGYVDFEATVSVEHVSLRYDDAEDFALKDASLHVAVGHSVALVGPTGAGKSTLADVILGVLTPMQGSVRISGVSPRNAIDRWPGAIAYVPQAVALVQGSVRENVALGLPREAISDDLVWEALRRSHLADFLIDNREGLDTSIGERGFRLSGGQRQRLGIARALYTRPRLLVLDEATSALDAETELAIIKTLEELEGEVTTITVAHRLATVRHADQVLYLDSGRIAARGSFEEVRAQVQDFDRQASLLGL